MVNWMRRPRLRGEEAVRKAQIGAHKRAGRPVPPHVAKRYLRTLIGLERGRYHRRLTPTQRIEKRFMKTFEGVGIKKPVHPVLQWGPGETARRRGGIGAGKPCMGAIFLIASGIIWLIYAIV